MDISNTESPTVTPVKKVSYRNILIGFICIAVFISVGFVAGRVSIVGCSTSVLGAQTSVPLSSRLAILFNIERPSQQTQTFQLAPGTETASPEPTEETTITPTPESGEPGMIWAGINRNPKPTSTPTPNNVITTPEQQNNGGGLGDEETPSPTPKYKTNWDRNTPTPVPTINELPDQDFNNQSDDRKRKPTSTPTPRPEWGAIEPGEVRQIIDQAGINIEKPEIIVNADAQGLIIHGAVKDALFGLLPVSYPVTIKMNEDNGNIETVSIPWWRTLFGNPFIGNVSKIRCGDGICSSTESVISCKTDCEKVCGNGICEFGEGTDTCSQDCGVSQ